MLKSLLRNFTVLSLGNSLGQAFMFLATVQLGRVLGPAGFAAWTFAQTWLFYMMRGGEFGLEVAGVRAVAHDGAQLGERAGSVLTLRLALAAFLLAGAWIAETLGLFPPGTGHFILAFSLGLLPVALSLEWVFEGAQRFTIVGFARIARGAAFFALVIFLVQSPADGLWGIYAYLAALAVPALYAGFLAWREYRIRPLPLTIPKAKALLLEAFPLGLATLLSQYALFFGTILIGYFSTKTELGYFVAADRLVVFGWAYGLVAANRVLLPALSRFGTGTSVERETFLASTTRMFGLVAIPIGVGCTLLSPQIIGLTYGAAYADASPVLAIVVWTLVLAVTRSSLEIRLIAEHRHRQYLTGMALLVGLHSVAVPLGFLNGGIAGVAVGMVVAELGYTLYLAILSVSERRRAYRLFPWRVGVAGAVVFGVGWVLQPHWVWKLALVGPGYLAMLLLLGEFSLADLAGSRAFFRRRGNS